MATNEAHRLQCLEVWGGNRPVRSAVAMLGLNAWVFSRPHGQSHAGGDVHYVSSCATGNVTRLLVADVSGHGSAVAEAAVQLRRLMRENADYLDQTRFVAELNDSLGDWAQHGRFATAVVVTFYAPTRVLSVCNAGHPPPLIRRAADGGWAILNGPVVDGADGRGIANVPLGVLDDVRYEQFEVRLEPGDVVVCYTDSLTESAHAEGRPLGLDGLLDVARRVPLDTPTGFIDRLTEEIAELREGNLTHDDVTVLVIAVNDAAGPA